LGDHTKKAPAEAGAMQAVEIASAVATALVATLVTALIATAAVSTLVATTMRGFTALASDFGHMVAVLADGFAALLGDPALLVVVHARESAVARITAARVVARLVPVRHSFFSSAIRDANICACSLQSSAWPDCAGL